MKKGWQCCGSWRMTATEGVDAVCG